MMIEKKKIKILDCTLRDGGYYNKWDFDRNIVDRYLTGVKNSSVDVVELGFRSLPKNSFMGPYLYTSDDFINQLDLPEGPLYGVMINGKEFIDKLGGNQSGIKKVFQKKKDSPISLVRIAINCDNVLESKAIARELKDMGYMVALNMMQAHGKSEEAYIKASRTINEWQIYDVLYFADSLGNMVPDDVKKICVSLKQGWAGPLGIHTHNNKNLALINSITAVENGVTWCDGTVAGMGRGAGNVSTESLILEMSQSGYHKGNVKMIQPVVKDFTVLKDKYAWGSNLYYHYAANHGIHPTFVQSLLQDKRYDNQQALGALEFLADKDSSAYSIDVMRRAIYGNQKNVEGAWDATDWLKNKEVLIVAGGPSVKKYKEGILQYIEKVKPAVLFLNINYYLPNSIATATIVSHETRALFDAQEYQNLGHPIILPLSRLGVLIKDQLKDLEILDYGLMLKEGTFIFKPNMCSLEWPLAAAYALAIITQAKANEIKLIGFDGFSSDDPRQREMNDVFSSYIKIKGNIAISALTPTTYQIRQDSIFSPIVR
jgi:4-hydroxy 2-oxovalerate aldolase